MNYYTIHITDAYQKLSLDECIAIIEKQTGISYQSMQGKTRKRDVVEARHLFFALATTHGNNSHEVIGEKINRDHSTVSFGIKNVHHIPDLIKKFEILNRTLYSYTTNI